MGLSRDVIFAQVTDAQMRLPPAMFPFKIRLGVLAHLGCIVQKHADIIS